MKEKKIKNSLKKEMASKEEMKGLKMNMLENLNDDQSKWLKDQVKKVLKTYRAFYKLATKRNL